MQIIIYLQDPKLILHPSIPLLSIVLCPTEEMGDVRRPRVPLKKRKGTPPVEYQPAVRTQTEPHESPSYSPWARPQSYKNARVSEVFTSDIPNQPLKGQ